MEKYGMFPENGNIVVGVSGGADSVCLLRVLARLKKSCGLRLTAVHINHRIRQEAGQDAAFVKKLCAEWEIPFVLVEEDVEALAAREHLSCEEAGRKVRYEAFAQVLAQMNAGQEPGGCVAVAHNSDDRAETLLFHMLRGTGLNGMASIRPVRDRMDGYRVIRPLLFASREEIEVFLQSEGISWCRDATNEEDLYTRNRIRNRILPYAQEQICERSKEHLAREAQLLADTADFVGRMTREALSRCSRQGEDGRRIFDTVLFQKEDPFLQQQMVLQGLLDAGTGKDLTAEHVEQALRLFAPSCQSGRRMELPICRVAVRREFGNVVVQPLGNDEASGDAKEEFPMRLGRQFLPGLGEVEAEILNVSDKNVLNSGFESTFLQDIPEKTYTKWFDYDKITKSAVFRTRRTGDYLTINDAGGRKSLKRYLIEEKIPADRRDELLLLTDGAHVMWVPGHRISAAYKVTAQTKQIVQVYLTGGKENV